MKIYVASKAKYAHEWRLLRDGCNEWMTDFEIISTWIDRTESDAERPGFWDRCQDEISGCDALIAMYVSGDVWKGAFVEIGMALALHKPVVLSGEPPGTWKTHPLVFTVPSLDIPAAFDHARRLVKWYA